MPGSNKPALTPVGQRTLCALLEYHAGLQPDAPFLIFEEAGGAQQRYSFADFDAAVNRTACVLTGLGLERGDRFILHLPNCPEFLCFWFAAAKLGLVMVPTNVASAVAEMDYIIRHSESRLVVTETGLVDTVRAAASTPIMVCRSGERISGTTSYAELVSDASADPPACLPAPSDVVGMLYTSGTTARPKGVLVTNAAYIYGAETVARGIGLTPHDRHIVVLPLFHGNAQYYSTMTAILVGCSMALMERFSASRFFNQAARYEATVASLFAAPMRMLLAQPVDMKVPRHRLRLAMFAQNITDQQVSEWTIRFGVPLLQIYGMTETIGQPLMNPLYYERKHSSLGLPVPGYTCRIVDERGDDVATGEVGELLVGGDLGVSLMQGYFKDPEATAATYRDSWLHTGDNVRADQDGYVYFVDRSKDMIKRAGENVAASEVEQVIKEHPAVFDAAAIGVPDPIRDEAIKVFVILKQGETVSEQGIIEWCRPRLAAFRLPEFVEFRDEFPRTSVGKIQKHLMRRDELARRAVTNRQ